MEPRRLLGMPLDEAEAALKGAGEAYRVAFTRPPRKQGAPAESAPLPSAAGREAFVVGARPGLLIAAWFAISDPRSRA